MNLGFLIFIYLIANLAVFQCQQTAELWISEPTKNNSMMIKQDVNLTFSSAATTASADDYVIKVDETKKYQQMDGFGASLTDAATWLLKYKLTDQKRKEIMTKVFGKGADGGINLSFLRQPLGATDFAWEAWSFDDVSIGDDFELSKFSLAREEDYIKPMLDMALSVNPGNIKLMASPWSPPAWMKTNRHLFGESGGSLRKDCYDVYARYFLRYIQENEKLGRKIYAISVQNEPQYQPYAYPGMGMTSAEQSDFIGNYLGPLFKKNNVSTKIISFDHNYDQQGFDYASDVLSNTTAYNFIAGTGFHIYAWPPGHQRMSKLHNDFPNKDIWMTEGGSGTWIGNGTQLDMFRDQMMHMIRGPRNYAKSVVFWNVALDQNSSPKLKDVDPPGTNRGLLTIRSDTQDSVSYEMGYYSLGHTTRFVSPGAYRIDSNTKQDDLETVAYQNNPNQNNGSIVLVLSNIKAEPKMVRVEWANKSVRFNMPASSGATLIWKSY